MSDAAGLRRARRRAARHTAGSAGRRRPTWRLVVLVAAVVAAACGAAGEAVTIDGAIPGSDLAQTGVAPLAGAGPGGPGAVRGTFAQAANVVAVGADGSIGVIGGVGGAGATGGPDRSDGSAAASTAATTSVTVTSAGVGAAGSAAGPVAASSPGASADGGAGGPAGQSDGDGSTSDAPVGGAVPATPSTAATAGSAPEGPAEATDVAGAPAPPTATVPNRFQPPCQVEPLARSAGLDAFYTKVCWAGGVPVVSSPEVSDLALQAAAEVLLQMLRPRPDLLAELVARKLRLGVIGTNQRAVQLPEYRDLPTSYPNTDWDAARAYGATPRRPLLAAPEENLVCSATDSYPGQSVLTHEVGHTVLDMAVAPNDRGFKSKVDAAYRQALANPVYAHTYALTNADEYWAEGVQDFFNSSRAAYGPSGGGDGYDGPIASRAALRDYDPALYSLIAEVFTEVDWRPTCP